tara:strand:+ start:181 stop:768 length:588 start_codon:yes stop_codon:yes gene_type:complete
MAIVFAFFITISLMLWFVIGSKGPWLLKAVVIALSLYLCLSIENSLSEIAGWPSDNSLPEKFIAHWIIVKEPIKKASTDEGAIYVWATNLSPKQNDDRNTWWGNFLLSFGPSDLTEPRSYRLPYSKGLHEEANDALGRIMKGERVGGTNNGKGKGKGEGNGNEEGEGEGEGGGTFSHSDDIGFHDLPAPHLPDKD